MSMLCFSLLCVCPNDPPPPRPGVTGDGGGDLAVNGGSYRRRRRCCQPALREPIGSDSRCYVDDVSDAKRESASLAIRVAGLTPLTPLERASTLRTRGTWAAPFRFVIR